MSYKTKTKRKEYYEKNKDKINMKRREYSNRQDVKKRIREKDRIWRENHIIELRKRNKVYSKKYKEKMRDLVFSHYGRKCSCCGEDNLSFLSIDHVKGSGTKHRKIIGNHIHNWLVKNNYPEGFQTLCFNCNWGKHLNRGICPHKSTYQKR